MDKRIKLLLVSIGIGLLVAILSTSYAFFTISNKEGTESVVTSGTMGLHLTDGEQITANSLLPGEYVEKEFSVENTGNVSTSYDIYLSEVVNTFTDKTDLVYEITSTDGGYETSGQLQVPSSSSKIIDAYPIAVNGEHHYKLKITFLNKNENQDDNQGAEFKAKVQINEYTDAGSNENVVTCLTLLEEYDEDDSVCNILTDNCDLDTIGNEVRIDKEHFFVLGRVDTNHVKLVSKYNLLFGKMSGSKSVYHEDTNTYETIVTYPTSDIPTNIYSYGKQNKLSTYIVWDSNHTLPDGSTCSYGGSKYSDNGPYYEVSNIKPYVDNYVTYLNSLGVNVTGRIVNDDDMRGLGCSAGDLHCFNMPNWFVNGSDSFFVDYPGYYGNYMDPSYSIATDECVTCVNALDYTRTVIILES